MEDSPALFSFLRSKFFSFPLLRNRNANCSHPDDSSWRSAMRADGWLGNKRNQFSADLALPTLFSFSSQQKPADQCSAWQTYCQPNENRSYVHKTTPSAHCLFCIPSIVFILPNVKRNQKRPPQVRDGQRTRNPKKADSIISVRFWRLLFSLLVLEDLFVFGM